MVIALYQGCSGDQDNELFLFACTLCSVGLWGGQEQWSKAVRAELRDAGVNPSSTTLETPGSCHIFGALSYPFLLCSHAVADPALSLPGLCSLALLKAPQCGKTVLGGDGSW